MNVAYNIDCLEAMREMPDNAFDLAVVDPPYGDGLHAEDGGGKGWFTKYNQRSTQSAEKNITWDVAPEQDYFDELFRVSRNQVIWGGNYFSLPPTRCFLIWRKLSISETFSMAMAEYAWTSFRSNAKVFEAAPQGGKTERFHPTQKPVGLYAWIYKLFAKPGYKILDTHLGSGSSRIAAYDAGLDFVGYEIDKTYFDLEEERFAKHIQQGSLFVPESIGIKQDTLF